MFVGIAITCTVFIKLPPPSPPFPDFCNNRQFYVIYCVTLAYVLFLKNFLFTIHDFKYLLAILYDHSSVQEKIGQLTYRRVR